MKLSESIKKTGFFWLPEAPETPLPGVLHISEIGEIVLEISYLSDNSKHRITGSAKVDWGEVVIISGIVDNDDITLYKSGMTKRNHYAPLSYGVSNITFHFDFAFFGFKYENEEEIMLSSMIFSIEGLREWLFLPGVNMQYGDKSEDSLIRFTLPEDIPICDYQNFNLEIVFSYSSNRSSFEANIAQEVYFCLNSTNLHSLDDFLDMIHKIHNFLCFVIDRMVYIQSVKSYSVEKLMKIGNHDTCRPIKIYYQSFPFSSGPTNIHRHGQLFPYSDIQDRFGNIMKKWIQSYDKIEPVFNLYFTSLSMFNTYSPERFLLLVRAMEVFHRKFSEVDTERYPRQKFKNMKNCILSKFPESSEMRSLLKEILMFANQIPLRQRITKMIQPFKGLYNLNTQQEIDSFVGNIVSTRNYFTHYGHKPKNTIDNPEDVYKLCIKMEALLQLCFLQLIGMDVEYIENIARKNNHFRHKLGLD